MLVHFRASGGWDKGQKVSEQQAITLLKNGNTLTTQRWDYQHARWVTGAEVGIEKVNNREILRTKPDASVMDNLDNLFNYHNII